MPVAIPPNHLIETCIFHITAIGNLPNILQSGYICAKNRLTCTPVSIANEEIQEKRNRKAVNVPPYGCIHDYVPFYFAPRSPMLYVNANQHIANARPQAEIVHLVTTAQVVAGAGLPFVFYDRHAMAAIAQPFNDLQHLDKIDWELFFEYPLKGGYAQYWQDRHDGANPKWLGRKEIRQAEFLVHERLPWNLIKGIATLSSDKAEEVQTILTQFGQATAVRTQPEWYY